MNKRNYIVTILFTLYLVNGLLYMWRQSLTYDERDHFHFAIQLLKGNTQRAGLSDYSKMPVSVLNALPRVVEQFIHRDLKKTDQGVSDILHGRYITLLISLLIGLYVFKWASELYGEKAGLFSLFLFVFCPNCLAHAVLVTTDAYSVLLLLTVLYYLWRWLSSGSKRDFLIFCVLTGVAQLVKQQLFHLYVIISCLLLLHFLAGDNRVIDWRAFFKKAGIFVLINLLVINAGFLFQGFGTPLADYHFMSGLFQGLQKHLSLAGRIPLPLPVSFVDGLDKAKYLDALGGGFPNSGNGNVQILGHSSNGGSFWYFYPVTCLFKTPIAVLVLIGWSLLLLLRKERLRSIARNELFLLLPVVYFFIQMDLFYKSQTNIRQILFIYPLLYVCCGLLFRYVSTVRGKRVMAFLCAAYLVSVFSYFRDYIPYTNEFIPDKKMAYQVVGAANLNFGQGQDRLEEYLRAHPGLFPVGREPGPGRQYMAIDDFLDGWNRHRTDWIKSFTPVDHIAHCYLIFDIKAGQLK
jgi:4-amino-4-deoxy-L-arabinose transferase-like glycosyltransferase